MPSGGGSVRTRWGIGEWYGQVASQLPVHVLNAYGQQGGKKVPAHHCPFGPVGPGGALQRCNKAGGACSLRPYQQTGTSVAAAGGRDACPDLHDLGDDRLGQQRRDGVADLLIL